MIQRLPIGPGHREGRQIGERVPGFPRLGDGARGGMDVEGHAVVGDGVGSGQDFREVRSFSRGALGEFPEALTAFAGFLVEEDFSIAAGKEGVLNHGNGGAGGGFIRSAGGGGTRTPRSSATSR